MDLDEVKAVAFDAYQYAYPLVIMDLTRAQATNVPDAQSVPMRAPVNQFAHYRTFPSADAQDVVRFNFDTLYSFAWLDLRQEPMVLSVPDSHGRYYLSPMLDMWTDVFAVPGTRTTDGLAGNYAITAPGWDGTLPDGVELLRSPTPIVWVMGRTQTNGPSDYPTVHAIQDGFGVTPLSSWGSDYTPPQVSPVDSGVDDTTAPQKQVDALSGVEFFTRFAELLRIHPPHGNDYPILARMKKIGLVPGQSFDGSALDPAVAAAIDEAAGESLKDQIAAITDNSIAKLSNQWAWIQGGAYGTAYRLRAMVAFAGLGCNLTEDAIYPNLAFDADWKPLTGQQRYLLRFEKGHLPPADAFWSITMYDEQGFQVPNQIDRFAIGDRDDLTYGNDGSVEIHIQHGQVEPAQQSNWLPAPDGLFQLTLRIYSPTAQAVRKGLTLPAITTIS